MSWRFYLGCIGLRGIQCRLFEMRMREGASNTDDGILSAMAYVCQITKYLVVTWATEGIIFFRCVLCCKQYSQFVTYSEMR